MHMCNSTGLFFTTNIILTLQIDIWMNQHCSGKERLRIIMRLVSDNRITLVFIADVTQGQDQPLQEV